MSEDELRSLWTRLDEKLTAFMDRIEERCLRHQRAVEDHETRLRGLEAAAARLRGGWYGLTLAAAAVAAVAGLVLQIVR
jgi:hypothetical protein